MPGSGGSRAGVHVGGPEQGVRVIGVAEFGGEVRGRFPGRGVLGGPLCGHDMGEARQPRRSREMLGRRASSGSRAVPRAVSQADRKAGSAVSSRSRTMSSG